MSRIEEFKDDVDLYSADLSRWPQDKVKAALELMKANPVAKAYFDAALKLDEKLRDYSAKPLNEDALALRIMAEVQKAPAQATPAPLKFNPAYIFAPGGGLLAAAIIGFVIGFYPQAQTDFLLDPVYYSQEQATDSSGMDAAISEEDVF